MRNSCVLDGSVYKNGQTFFPSCKYQCMCHDGQIACVPRCNLDVMLPGPDCPMPRKVQVPGECCEKWVCDPPPEARTLGGFAMAGEWASRKDVIDCAHKYAHTASFLTSRPYSVKHSSKWVNALKCIKIALRQDQH